MTRCLPFLLVTLTLTGCATALEPRLGTAPIAGFDLVDPSRVDAGACQKDFGECASIANQDLVDIQASAGAFLSTAADKFSLGLIGSRPSKHADRVAVLKRCLSGRGYSVLR